MIVSAIEWLGRRGAKAIAISLFLGLALPPVSALARPLLPAALFVLLMLAFMRVDGSAIAAYARRPGMPLLAASWIMLALPLITGAAAFAIGLDSTSPAILLALVLMACAPPINSTPAYCFLLGLNSALSLTILILACALTPLAAPLLAGLMVEQALPLSPVDLAGRLAFLLGGSAAAALVLRRALGRARIAARGTLFDGLNVVLMFVFAVAIMDGVAVRFVAEPLVVLGLVALSFVVAGLFLLVTAFIFRRAGWQQALTLAISAGNRNMGLFAAAMTGSLPEITWIYFALAQFPIYLMPVLIAPLVRRLAAPAPPARLR